MIKTSKNACISVLLVSICAVLLFVIPIPTNKGKGEVIIQLDSIALLIFKELEQNMVFVEGGIFMMGSDVASDDAKPIHQVFLDDYYIGKYEVTQQQWEAVMGNNPSYFKGENLPVETITWDDVQQFILNLNKITGKQYRLPTEAEWEFAARGGNQSNDHQYSGSDILDDVGWYIENSRTSTHVVGTKSPNELGIYDMSGNVIEWCNDWYEHGYYSISPERNPQGAKTGGSDKYKIIRGGSYVSSERYSRVTLRSWATFSDKGQGVGFRLSLSV